MADSQYLVRFWLGVGAVVFPGAIAYTVFTLTDSAFRTMPLAAEISLIVVIVAMTVGAAACWGAGPYRWQTKEEKTAAELQQSFPT